LVTLTLCFPLQINTMVWLFLPMKSENVVLILASIMSTLLAAISVGQMAPFGANLIGC
jgi:hypothetical protein